MIVTFYSYKGGVGRTQLCANTAAYLCYYKSKKILLWDWDFEAPGLHYYFGKQNEDIVNSGTLELFEQYARLMRSRRNVVSADLPRINKEEYIIRLATAPPKKTEAGFIDLMPAGRYTKDFSQRANEFSWFEFYEMLDGANYLDNCKEQLSSLGYDYIFVDSRTGISDYSGICNIQLPDINVMVVAPTMQNFRGSANTARAILDSRYIANGLRKPHILPILSRLDRSHPKFNDWIQSFINDFSFLLSKFDSDVNEKFRTEIFADTYLQETFLQYNESISAGENIFFDGNARHLPRLSFARTFINIAEYIEKIKNDGTLNLYSKVDMDSWLGYAEKSTDGNLPDKAAYAFTRAGLILIQSDPQRAIGFFEEALRSDANNQDALFFLGVTFFNLNQKNKAIEYFQKCIELDPKSIDAYYYLGCVYADNPKKDKALQCFTTVITLSPKHIAALFEIGKIYHVTDRQQLALENFRNILKLDPTHDPAWYYTGAIFAAMGDIPPAIDGYQHAIALNPNSPLYHWSLGELLAGQDRDKEAIEHFGIAVANDPENASLYGWLGYLLRKQKDYEAAIPIFKKSIEFDSGYRWAYASLALCYKMLGRDQEYQDTRAEAVGMEFGNLETEYQKACLEAMLGNVDSTIQYLQQAFLKKQKLPGFIARDIDFDCIRDDPKFIEFMEQQLNPSPQLSAVS